MVYLKLGVCEDMPILSYICESGPFREHTPLSFYGVFLQV